MTDGQAEDMLNLLERIVSKLDEINSKINSSYDLSDVCSKLDDLDTRLGYIESNTSS